MELVVLVAAGALTAGMLAWINLHVPSQPIARFITGWATWAAVALTIWTLALLAERILT